MVSRWSEELWRILGPIGLGVLLGLMAGNLLIWVLLGMAVALTWQVLRLRRLSRWLRSPTPLDVEPAGLWGEVYCRVRRMESLHERRETALEERFARLEQSARALPDAVVAVGPEWDILWMNDVAAGLLNLRRPGDYGQAVTNLIRQPQLLRYLDNGDFGGPLETLAPGNPDIKLLVRVRPYGEGNSLMVAQDVTERYRLERVRRDFVANVSHELRTPLTVVSGYLENLRFDEGECARRWSRPLEMLDQQARRMRGIVEDLLMLAGLENDADQGLEARANVPAMLWALESELEERTVPHAQVSFDVDPELDVVGVENLLRSAFNNLLGNALNYTDADGHVSVRWSTSGGDAHFSVSDTGEGIAPQHLERLTERFYRVDPGRSRQKGGTGLGLAIVKHVMQRHGGRLEVQSELGQGSVFTCVLPGSRVTRTDASQGQPAIG